MCSSDLCIIMPCNTAHYWYEDLKESTQATFLSIIEATCQRIINDRRDSVAILATTATIRASLYQRRLTSEGVKCIIPDDLNQSKIMQSIISYKSGNYALAFNLMAPYIRELDKKGVNSFIMGCTEIPLILKSLAHEKPGVFIDATDELIKQALNWYYTEPNNCIRNLT